MPGSVSNSIPREREIESRSITRFGRGQDGVALLKRGWGEPESGFVWSEGKVATLTLPVFFGRNRILISAWGYVPPKALHQDVLVFIKGYLRGFFQVDGPAIIEVIYEQFTDETLVETTFYMPDAVSPASAEGSTDDRVLGIALSVIDIIGERKIYSQTASLKT